MQVFRRVIAVALVLTLLAGAVQGGVVGPDLLVVTASNSAGIGSWRLPVPPDFEFGPDGTYEWNLPQPTSIFSTSGGAHLANITSLSLRLVEDPSVSVSFNVQSGAANTDFSITSALLSFPSLSNPPAFATAAITATDANNDGVTITGLQPTSKIYRASYNSTTDWALLIDSQTGNPDTSIVATGRRPAVGTEIISDTVSSMQAQFGFRLTAGDTGSGTSNFEVIPEPASLMLLGLTAIAAALRRRR